MIGVVVTVGQAVATVIVAYATVAAAYWWEMCTRDADVRDASCR